MIVPIPRPPPPPPKGCRRSSSHPFQTRGERREDLVVKVPAKDAPQGLQVRQRVSLGGRPAVVTAITAESVEATRKGSIPISSRRTNTPTASSVWNVE